MAPHTCSPTSEVSGNATYSTMYSTNVHLQYLVSLPHLINVSEIVSSSAQPKLVDDVAKLR